MASERIENKESRLLSKDAHIRYQLFYHSVSVTNGITTRTKTHTNLRIIRFKYNEHPNPRQIVWYLVLHYGSGQHPLLYPAVSINIPVFVIPFAPSHDADRSAGNSRWNRSPTWIDQPFRGKGIFLNRFKFESEVLGLLGFNASATARVISRR